MRKSLIARGGEAFAGLRHALLEMHFKPEDLGECKVTLEVPRKWHREEIIMRLKSEAIPPFQPTENGTWFGIPFEIKVKDD